MQKITEGRNTPTVRITFCRAFPPNSWLLRLTSHGRRYRRAEAKPATKPSRTKRMTAHVTMLPRYCGDSTPSAASTTTITMVHTTCDYASRTLATPTPTPTSDANMSLFCGGRNTSPWISFQPPSSTVSSRSSSLYASARAAGCTMELYLEMSRESVRRMIIPTMVYI